MLERRPLGKGWKLGYGGDTLNLAIHLARLGHDTAYFTALGTDGQSETLKAQWASEGLDISLVLKHPVRGPGLYTISTDEYGERSFSYDRGKSAAREMFALQETTRAITAAARTDLLVFSLISLAILPREGREALLALARGVRENGGRVAFDGNYRSRLWTNTNEAIHWRDAASGLADFGLPTFDDEASLSGEASAEAVARHWQELGCGEVVVKLGAGGCRLPDGEICPPPIVLAPIDTSGAGDAFDAGYLSARLDGAEPEAAARAGHALAGWTIMRPGAIPPKDS
ncbi:MAG: sugar kinase [Novosphingobium sp.]